MYQNIFISKKDWTVHLWDDKTGYSTFPYPRYAYKKQKGGKYRSIYGDELTKINNFDEKDHNLFESDVPAETRVLLDLYEDSDEPSIGHRVGVIDIEVSSEGGFPVIEDGDKEITGITLYDQMTKHYFVYVLDKKHRMTDDKTADTTIRCYDDEDTMLMSFLDKWQECAFTVITGWNIDYFDMPYLYHRLKRCMGPKVAKCLSPVGICYMNAYSKRMVIAGMSSLDYILLYKKYSGRNEPSYALAPIGKKVVGIDKVTYHGSLMDLYNNDIEKFVEYNLTDVKIVVALDEKLKFIDLARRLCHVGHVPYENFHMSSRYLEGAVLLFLKRNGGLIAPNKRASGQEEYEQQEEEGEEGFSGAFVKEPVPGRYNWVFDLDLTSMYPNIIISLNISPETKAAKIAEVKLADDVLIQKRKDVLAEIENMSKKDRERLWSDDEGKERYIDRRCKEFDTNYYIRNKIVGYKIGNVDYTPEEIGQMLTDKNYSIASNGVMYSQEHVGVIPAILSVWFHQRKDMRKKAAECRKSGDNEGYFFNNQRQQVWKILLNSMYGVLGLPVFRFYDVDNASAVTTTGVSIIRTTDKVINQFYGQQLGKTEGDWVIYSDTDSCFVDAVPMIKHRYPEVDFNDEVAMSEAILKVTADVQSYVNQFYNVMAKRFFNLDKHYFDAKQEVIAKTAFWLAKKRYAQWIIHKEGAFLKEPELEVKGFDVVRTSYPASFRKFMEQFLRDLLSAHSKEQLDETLLQFKEKIKTLPVFEIAKNTSVKFVSQDGKYNYNPDTRRPFQVILGSPAQVKACLFYNDLLTKFGLQKKVEPIHHGQKIKWVYVKENSLGIDCLAMKADGTDPDKILEFIDTYVDRTAMFDQELKSKLVNDKKQGIYDVLKWNFPSSTDKIAEEFFDFGG